MSLDRAPRRAKPRSKPAATPRASRSRVVTQNKDDERPGPREGELPVARASRARATGRAWRCRWPARTAASYFLPEVGDEVLVAFERGDLRFPYVLGSLWNGKDKPPSTNDDGKNDVRMIHSRARVTS